MNARQMVKYRKKRFFFNSSLGGESMRNDSDIVRLHIYILYIDGEF